MAFLSRRHLSSSEYQLSSTCQRRRWGRLGSLICTAASGVAALITFTLSNDAKDAGENSKARLLMFASVVAGVVTALGILTLLTGP